MSEVGLADNAGEKHPFFNHFFSFIRLHVSLKKSMKFSYDLYKISCCKCEVTEEIIKLPYFAILLEKPQKKN